MLHSCQRLYAGMLRAGSGRMGDMGVPATTGTDTLVSPEFLSVIQPVPSNLKHLMLLMIGLWRV
jgi:hypothetical protein